MIVFTVYGEPVAQGRPKFTTVNGHPRAFDPEKSATYKTNVRYEALKVKPDKPLEVALSLIVIAYRSVPKSWSGKKAKMALAGEIQPTTKPDIDNIIKGVKDALKGVIWRDDSQVIELHGSKRYSDLPRVEVVIKEM